MTNAPDRIRVWPDYNDHFSPARPDWTGGIWDDTDDVNGVEYIRADISQATVEAKLKEAADIWKVFLDAGHYFDVGNEILSLIPDPGALDRVIESKLAEEIEISNKRGNMIELELLPSLHDLEAKLDKALEALNKLSTSQVFGDGEALGTVLTESPLGREIIARKKYALNVIEEIKGNKNEK